MLNAYLTYQHRLGCHIFPASFSPYLLEYGWLTTLTSPEELPYIIHPFCLPAHFLPFSLLAAEPGFPSLSSLPSPDMVQGHVHSTLSQMLMPLAMLSLISTINTSPIPRSSHGLSFSFLFFSRHFIRWGYYAVLILLHMVEEGGGGYRILSFGGLVNLDRKKKFSH